MGNIKIILLYNNGNSLPFHLSAKLRLEGWTVTTNHAFLQEATVVVFHLPTLSELITSELEKQAGQIWIAWKQSKTMNIKPGFLLTWGSLFDFELTFTPQCYWECSTTYYSRHHPYRTRYSLLEEITDSFRKVDFMIIGTQKGGSTALYEYLNQHSSCWESHFKEPDFFLFPSIYSKGFLWYTRNMWRERAPLRNSRLHNLLFESTSWYSYWYEVPGRLYEYNPDLKLIFLVRNPIDRAYSQYNMLKNWSKMKIQYEYSLYRDKTRLSKMINQLLDTTEYTFSYWAKLEIEKLNKQEISHTDFFPDFLHRGFYYDQLQRLYQFFPKENILIIESNELKNERILTLKRIESFLKIPAIKWENLDLDEKFKSHYTDHLSLETREQLKGFFKPYNEKFYQLVDKDFNWK